MSELRKNLSTLHGTGLILNVVLGAGLLALPGLVVQQVGNHGIWAWLFCAISAVPLLMVSVLMGSRFPNAGGIAHFAGMAFGRKAYAMVSMLFLGAAVFGLPAITLTGGYYLGEIVPLPPVASACGILLACMLINLISPKIVSIISSCVALAIFLSLIGLIGMGAFVLDWAQVPASIPLGSDIDWSKITNPYMMIFFAFTGWEVAASLSEEFRDPKRDFPRAMIFSFMTATLVYLSMAFTVQNITLTSSHEAAFVSIAAIAFGTWGEIVIATLAVLIVFANIVGAIWVVSRLLFAFSREGYLPVPLGINSHGSPVSAIILSASFILLMLIFHLFELIAIDEMLAIAGQNFFVIFILVSLALFKLLRGFLPRLFASISLLIVATGLLISAQSLLYPALLMLIGGVIGYRKTPSQNTTL